MRAQNFSAPERGLNRARPLWYPSEVMSLAPPSRPVSERALIFLIGAVQFVNILDFMMVSPLGPDYAAALDMPEEHIGLVVGAYTLAAGLAGFAGSFFLDRFDRRKALAVAMLGLALGTLSGALATGMWTLLAARLLAGAFGGPATSLALSIVADVIPDERRGRALGAVAGAFSIASIIGVPAGLELARRGGWRFPFIVVGVLGLLIVVFAVRALPPMTAHLARRHAHHVTLADLFGQPLVLLSYLMTATVMMGGFLVMPHVPAYTQKNLGYPRADFGWLYLAGGVCNFFAMRLAGRVVDRYGSFTVGTIGSLVVAGLNAAWFIWAPGWMPVMGIFVAYMVTMAFRNVAYNTLTSKVPASEERARFMSMQSMVQHAASGVGAALSNFMLGSRADGTLVHMDRVGLLAVVLTLTIPALLYAVESRVRGRAAAAALLATGSP
jgi:predicted MFS family arabinose efflux permease